MRSLVKLLFFGSLVLMAVSFCRRDELPLPDRLVEQIYEEPRQRAVRALPAAVTVNGVQYSIQPRYAYELAGLVVAFRDLETWQDYANEEWSDNLNVVDLCVVWGSNARNGAYRFASFRHSRWKCFASWHSAEGELALGAISNNHLITVDPALARRLRQVRIGDQVRFRGYLADYTTYRNGSPAGTRVSSTVRNDSGEGACEVVYIEDFEVLQAASGWWRMLGKIGLAAFLLSIVAWFLLRLRVE